MRVKKIHYFILILTIVSAGAFSANQPKTQPLPSAPEVAKVDSLAENKVNLNTADATTLAAKLKGVGLKKAQAIVEYREKYGLFTDIKQLVEVPGFGENLVKRIIANLTL